MIFDVIQLLEESRAASAESTACEPLASSNLRARMGQAAIPRDNASAAASGITHTLSPTP